MPQPDHIMDLPVPDPDGLDDDLKAFFAKCDDKLGLVPNVLKAYSLRPAKLRNFIALYNELMLGDSGLSAWIAPAGEMWSVVTESPSTARMRAPWTPMD